ncbi:MAG: sigma factor-like helix-turn-helix DNA-binding protein [Candidatus Pacebacteria bacterium]|nr:sigma factor-like helix-turn-helix DNA-binding protein [Candidatus Paceibacterota bacterium]
MNQNYQKICQDLLKKLSPRIKDVILRRFALKGGEKETLESIGKDLKVTRERVRQIEESGLEKIRPEIKNYSKIYQDISEYISLEGGLKKENVLLEKFGGKKYQAQINFLLSLSDDFKRFGETEDFYSFWTNNEDSFELARKTINSLLNKLKEIGKPITFDKLKSLESADEKTFLSFLEISKKIQKNQEGLYGLKEWPEINPRGIKDKAFLIFKKVGKPLHFTDVTKLIEGALTQTVHNELIRDSRFVLVGRGIYALSEWGYKPGQVKDVILKILKESKRPMTKEEVLSEVAKQRLVKENTILLNLSNKNYFSRDPEGKYIVREI